MESAQAQVVAYIGYQIEETTYTDDIFDLNGEKKFILPNYPVISISSIEINNDGEWDPLTTYTLQKSRGMIVHDTFFPRGYGRLKVSYTAGYDETTVPAVIKQAILSLATLGYQNNQSGGIKREKIDGASEIEYADSSTSSSQILSTLNPYKRYA